MFRRGLLWIVIGLIIYSCGGARSTSLSNHSQIGIPPGEETKETRKLTKRERLLAEAERTWAKRDEYEQVKNAIEYWHRALSLDSRDAEIWNRISYAYLFLAELLCVLPEIHSAVVKNKTDGQNAPDASESPHSSRIPLEQDGRRKPPITDLGACQTLKTEAEEELRRRAQIDSLLRGKQAAEQSLALLAPDISKQIEENVFSIESLANLKTNAIPALYWRSTTLNALSRTKGFTERVIQKDPITISMATCLEKNPRYDYAGPHRYFGTFFARPLSLADKDLKKSQMHFKRAIAIAPGYFANRYAYARDYAVMAQDRNTFETQLKIILEANVESDPSTAPENRIYRRKAEILLRLASEYFE